MIPLDYDLHKLGWRAFQDLSAVILQVVLGQAFHTFADSNDAGRDGAYFLRWRTQDDPELQQLAGVEAVTAQCKFSMQGTGTLTPSMLTGELTKVRRLKIRGLCDAYLLLTNLAVSGRTDAWLKDQLRAVGVEHCLVLDGRWICQQISRRPDLRRYVPRVYGLGDLGKILDDRRLRQARSLLSRLQSDLATFVPTATYRQAADAIADHGFVLLLGEPACGKSTIAATLAMTALDNWKCGVRRVDSAEELVASWDPDEPDQLFWIDDAFGAIRHDAALTDGWSRRMDQVMTAVSQGARLILTSRDYIYRDARPHLKVYAYPRLREQAVVVDVTGLTTTEKRQILYNHLRAGDQPRQTLERWRPHLLSVAAVTPFQPEVARRLSWQAFTHRTDLHSEGQLVRYMERPVTFLSDVLRQLEPGPLAALACVYLAGNELAAPIQFTPALTEAIQRLGATEGNTLSSFAPLDGTFLQLSTNAIGDPVWRFRHPTIREGFATVVAADVNAVGIFIDGLSDDELLQQVDCGGAETRGALVRVPATLYPRVVPRVVITDNEQSWANPFAQFLQHRCSPEFLRAWSRAHEPDLERLLRFGPYLSACWEPGVLGVLHRAGALPEEVRRRAVKLLAEEALEMFDGGWLDDPVCDLFTADERDELLEDVRSKILPHLEREIDYSADGYDSGTPPEHRYEEARNAISAYKDAFAGDKEASALLGTAEAYVTRRILSADSDWEPQPSSRLGVGAPLHRRVSGERDEFEDIADGR